MIKKKITSNICNALMAVGIVASASWLGFHSAIFWGETELPLDLRERK